MSYAGYVIKINGAEVPNNIMVPGSFTVTTEKRIAHQWKDVLGTDHFSYFPNLKHRITFTVKARTKEENDILKAFTSTRDSVPVEFWSDDHPVDAYTEIYCKLEDVTFTHRYDSINSVYYDAITLTYTEY